MDRMRQKKRVQNRRRPAWLIIWMAWSISAHAADELGALAGRIFDDQGLPLAGANVVLKELNTGDASDAAGEFRISSIPPGSYTLLVSFIGFTPYQQPVDITPLQTKQVEIQLQPGVLELGTLLVVGEYLKGQAKALAQQLADDRVSVMVSADQLTRFPDQSVGDALKRLPAVSVNYDQGEARYVNIRGMEPRLNSIALDGERLPSPDAETRAVQLDMISTDMIQNIEVYKSNTPDMDGDAVGGMVNLVTRPIVYIRQLKLNAGSGYDFLTGRPLWSGSAMLGQRFFAERLGVSITGSINDRRLGSHNSEGIWTFDKKGGIYPLQWDVRRYDVRRLRRGFTVGLDFRADEQNRFFFACVLNQRDDWETRQRLRYRLEPPGKNNISEKSQIYRQTKGGIGDNDNARLERQLLSSFRLKGKHDLLNLMTVEWTLSHSRVAERRPHERYLQWWVKEMPVQIDLADLREPHFYAQTEDSLFKFEEMREEFRNVEERDTRMAVDVRLPLIRKGRWKNSLQFGGKIKALRKRNEVDGHQISLTPAGKSAWKNMTRTPLADYTPPLFYAGDYSLGNFTTPAFLASLNFDDESFFKKKPLSQEYGTRNYHAEENISSAYWMLQQSVGKRLELIAGARLEQTGVAYDGYELIELSDSLSATKGQSDYVHLLPSLHLRYEPLENTVLRAAYSQSVSRPDFYDLIPYRELKRAGEVLYAGNPALLPAHSRNLDFTVERYDRAVGLISAGIFHKSLDRFFYVQRENNVVDPVTGKKISEYYQPRNGGSGRVSGIELGVQKKLDFLPGFFSGMNFYANFTRLFSRASYPSLPGRTIPLPGSAKHTLNMNLTFETKTVTAGISLSHASPYLDPKDIDLTPGLERWYDAVTFLDLNGTWRLSGHLQLYFELNNLLNQPLRFYAGMPERTYQIEYFGPRAAFGCKYVF